MPAPRYANDLQETAVWLSLAGVWAAGGLLAWIFSAASHAPWVGSGSGPTVLAALAGVISVALRLPILSASPNVSPRSAHVGWLLGTAASLNWLGFFILKSPHWPDALPAILLVTSAELWFHIAAWRRGALPWLHTKPASWARTLEAPSSPPKGPSVHRPTESLNIEPYAANCVAVVAGSDQEPTPEALDEHVERRQVQGTDERGQRYLSGEIRVSLAADQALETVIVAFSPPFSGDPAAELECAEDQIEVRLVNCTPVGMRVEIRRLTTGHPLVFPLQWYATEVELDSMSTRRNAKRVLP